MFKRSGIAEERPPMIQVTPSMAISPRTNEEKLTHLIKQTGMEKEIAKEFLESNYWHLEKGWFAEDVFFA